MWRMLGEWMSESVMKLEIFSFDLDIHVRSLILREMVWVKVGLEVLLRKLGG